MTRDVEREFLDFISWLSKREIISVEEAEDLRHLTERYAHFQEKAGRTKEEIYAEIGKGIAEKIIENLIEKKASGFLDEGMAEKLKSIPGMRLSALGGKKAADILKERLFFIGVLGLTDNNLITTGYFKSRREDPFIPTNLSIAVFNLGSLLDDESLQNIVINKVLELYQLSRPRMPFKSLHSSELIEEFYAHLKYIVFRIKWSYKEVFENLQDSLVFYNRSLALYTKESGSMNIFSTSSGIVIPEEYRGDVASRKNPYRKKYFDKGIASPLAFDLPKFYQWDSETTPKNLYKGFALAVDKESYKKEAVQILSRFLMLPNFEITEAPFREDPWKIFFTLVSDKSIVFSERGEMRKINHGYMIDEDILKINPDVYDEIAGLLWRREDGIIGSIKKAYKRNALLTYKDLNQVCKSQKEAEEMARDIVELLLEDGKRLAERENRVKAEVVEIVKEKPYARMWTNETINEKEGDLINFEEYKNIIASLQKYQLFIIDHKGINQIYVNGALYEGKLIGIAYELLKYLLKAKGAGGDAFFVWKDVWKPSNDQINYVKKKIEESGKKLEGGTPYYQLYKTVTKIKHKLNKFFSNANLDWKICFENKSLRIKNIHPYCLIEVINEK